MFTPELGDRICEQLANGDSLVKVCEPADMPARITVIQWLGREEEHFRAFAYKYARAREAQAEYYASKAMAVADEAAELEASHQVNAAKLRVDTLKWTAARMAPRSWGDRQQVALTGEDGGPVTFRWDDGGDET